LLEALLVGAGAAALLIALILIVLKRIEEHRIGKEVDRNAGEAGGAGRATSTPEEG
jgi:hypothetical protein